MKLLFGKIILYLLLIFILLEVIVRVFHLYEQYPQFIINDKKIKTYAPNQDGFYVTGNRRMNFAQYHINESGFNSYREFTPTKKGLDIALIGDSYIDGLHQNYYNSIGKKIERKLNNEAKVFEYGHVGYDLADQLYLISAYKEKFELIDIIVLYLKFENDLHRNTYEPDQYWVDSQYFTFSKIQKNLKLFAYLKGIGAMEPLRNLKNSFFGNNSEFDEEGYVVSEAEAAKYIENFKTLVNTYGFNKGKTVFLINKDKTNKSFLEYCDSMGYKYLDFGDELKKSKKNTTLIYDMHWNNNGRNIIASVIADYIKKKDN